MVSRSLHLDGKNKKRSKINSYSNLFASRHIRFSKKYKIITLVKHYLFTTPFICDSVMFKQNNASIFTIEMMTHETEQQVVMFNLFLRQIYVTWIPDMADKKWHNHVLYNRARSFLVFLPAMFLRSQSEKCAQSQFHKWFLIFFSLLNPKMLITFSNLPKGSKIS